MFPGRNAVTVTPGFGVLWAGTALALGPVTGAALFASALLHELGHVIALRACGCGIGSLRCTAFGFEMATTGMTSYKREAITALAGPGASFLLCLLSGTAAQLTGIALLRQLAGMNLVLTMFNLLPASPLDGGRALSAVTGMLFGEEISRRVARYANIDVCAALGLTGICLAAKFGTPAPLAGAAAVIIKCCNC